MVLTVFALLFTVTAIGCGLIEALKVWLISIGLSKLILPG